MIFENFKVGNIPKKEILLINHWLYRDFKIKQIHWSQRCMNCFDRIILANKTINVLIGFDVIDNWNTELEKMNKDKKGRKFVYPDSFIKLLGYMRVYFHLPYRQTEGVVREHGSSTLPSIPDYSNISRRINRLDIKINNKNKNNNDDYFVIAIDSTGIKVTNRGEWMRHSGM